MGFRVLPLLRMTRLSSDNSRFDRLRSSTVKQFWSAVIDLSLESKECSTIVRMLKRLRSLIRLRDADLAYSVRLLPHSLEMQEKHSSVLRTSRVVLEAF